MLVALQIATLLFVVLTLVTTWAHALQSPGKRRLDREHYLAVQPTYYPGFTIAGGAEPLAILALGGLLAMTPAGTAAFWLIAGALALAIATHAIYWLVTAPVNKVWVKDVKLAGGAQRFFDSGGAAAENDWTVLRDRWERSHLCRAATSMAAFLLLATALLAARP